MIFRTILRLRIVWKEVVSGGSQHQAQSNFYLSETRYYFIHQSLRLPAFSVLLYNRVASIGMILALCPLPVLNGLL